MTEATSQIAPLLPATVDLRMFRRMPLDVARLRDSDIARDPDPEGFRCAVLAWCVAWHQVPAASLPDDDRALADLVGIGRTPRAVKEWQGLRKVALRGFVKCSDGRLYHRVVAEMAVEAWGAHLQQRWKTHCSSTKKHQQRHKLPINLPTFGLWITANCPEAEPYVSLWTRRHVPEDTPQKEQGHPPPVPRETGSKGREGISTSTTRGDSSNSVTDPPAAYPHPSGPEARESKPRTGSWRRDPSAAMRKMTELGIASYGLSHAEAIAKIEDHLREKERRAA